MNQYTNINSQLEALKLKDIETYFYEKIGNNASIIPKVTPFKGINTDMLYIKDNKLLFIKFMDTTEDLFFILEEELLEVMNEEYELLKIKMEQSKLNIEYKSAQGKSSKRVIRPYALFTYYEANYCIAYCEERKELRQFKLMRIDNIELLNEKFEKMDFDIDSYLYNTMGLFKDELVKMKLKISYPYAKGFSEVSWIKDEKITDYIDEGYLIYEAECFGKKHIINWIMSMGSNCEVLEPKALKDEIIKEYENILKNIYKGAR